MTRVIALFVMLGGMSLVNVNCTPTKPNPLDKLGTVDLSIKGQAFTLWIADSADEKEHGLMFVTREQMTDLQGGTRRGMIFVFGSERQRSFWMKNTIIALDIAYLDAKGTVLSMHTMVALDDRHGQYPSNGPAMFAIEVNAAVYAEIGLRVGDRIDIPPDLRNRTP